MIRKPARKRVARSANTKATNKTQLRQQIARQISRIAEGEIKKAIQVTRQKAKDRPIEDFPKTIGITDLGEGFWAARINVGGIELLIEPISEKEPWLVRTQEGNVVRLSKKFKRELKDKLWKMWEETYPKIKVNQIEESGSI